VAVLLLVLAMSRPALHVYPTVAAPGARVHLTGNAGDCPRGDAVFILSRAFTGHVFAGVGGVRTAVRAGGSFAAYARVRLHARAGVYVITARCGGGNLGVSPHLRVRK